MTVHNLPVKDDGVLHLPVVRESEIDSCFSVWAGWFRRSHTHTQMISVSRARSALNSRIFELVGAQRPGKVSHGFVARALSEWVGE